MLRFHQYLNRIKESFSAGKWADVFAYYRDIKRTEIEFPEPSFLHPILKSCLALGPRHGKSVQACFIKQGLDSFTSIANSITDFYMKSGVISSARTAFNSSVKKDSVSWNIIIHGYLDIGEYKEGLWLFTRARVSGFFEPNIATLVLVIRACGCVKDTREGVGIHAYTIRSGTLGVVSVQNSLLNFYVDVEMGLARRMFDEMPERDLISWSTMIGGYVQGGEPEVAVDLFRELISQKEIEIDAQIMVHVIKASIYLEKMSKLVHGVLISRGFCDDLFVGNSLIDTYSKCFDIESASRVFREMNETNIVSWNSLLSGFVGNDKYVEALEFFDSMQRKEIKADEVTLINLLQTRKHVPHYMHCKSIHCTIIRSRCENNELLINSLIDAYTKNNLIGLAYILFRQTEEKRDTVTWSTMIAGFTNCGMPNEAIKLFQEMYRLRKRPNSVTIINLLEACSLLAEVKRSKSAHGIAIRSDLAADVAVGTAIIDTYSKCGDVKLSEIVFKHQLPQKNVISWSAMINAYGMNGLPHEALALVREMRSHGVKPNPVTTLSVLSSCSHGGLIEEGLAYFNELVKDHGRDELRLEHYSCIVDLLARAGKLDSAMELIKKMPNYGIYPGPSAWGAFLSACRKINNKIELCSDAISRVLELEPCNSAGYLMGSSIYASGGSWDVAARMRWQLRERGVKVIPGYSLVHVNDNAFKFVAGDKQHSEVCVVTRQLHLCLKMDKLRDQGFIELL